MALRLLDFISTLVDRNLTDIYQLIRLTKHYIGILSLQVGLEPTTNRLTVDRSTTELLEL